MAEGAGEGEIVDEMVAVVGGIGDVIAGAGAQLTIKRMIGQKKVKCLNIPDPFLLLQRMQL